MSNTTTPPTISTTLDRTQYYGKVITVRWSFTHEKWAAVSAPDGKLRTDFTFEEGTLENISFPGAAGNDPRNRGYVKGTLVALQTIPYSAKTLSFSKENGFISDIDGSKFRTSGGKLHLGSDGDSYYEAARSDRSGLIRVINDITARYAATGQHIKRFTEAPTKLSQYDFNTLERSIANQKNPELINVANLLLKAAGEKARIGDSAATDVMLRTDWVSPYVGAAIVPTSNPISHNYALGQPVIVVQHGSSYTQALRHNGVVGNNLFHSVGAIRAGSSVTEHRIATEAEVEQFVSGLSESAVSALRGYLRTAGYAV